jgi:selenocysteine-specific elongation factor
MAVVRGDRFIIRSPEVTLGGGEIFETHARRYRRHQPAVINNLARGEKGGTDEVIRGILDTHGSLELPVLSKTSGVALNQLIPVVDRLIDAGEIIGIGTSSNRLLFTPTGWKRVSDQVRVLISDYHKKYPLRFGIPGAELSSRLKTGNYGADIVKRLVTSGDLAEEGNAVRLPGHNVRLTGPQQTKIENFLKSLEQKPYDPPSNLVPEHDLLNLLIAGQKVVKVSEDVVFSRAAYEEMLDRILSHMMAKGDITVAEVRDMFKTSRKYALALMEYLDGRKVTRRTGDRRVLYRESGG